MQNYPIFVSAVAIMLGGLDIVRGVSHTLLSAQAATHVAGLDLSGPTGHDQLVLMSAFGASNFLSAAALIYLALRDRFGALLFLAVLPIAYLLAQIGLRVNGADLVGQGDFRGRYMMTGYLSICILTVIAALATRQTGLRG